MRGILGPPSLSLAAVLPFCLLHDVVAITLLPRPSRVSVRHGGPTGGLRCASAAAKPKQADAVDKDVSERAPTVLRGTGRGQAQPPRRKGRWVSRRRPADLPTMTLRRIDFHGAATVVNGQTADQRRCGSRGSKSEYCTDGTADRAVSAGLPPVPVTAAQSISERWSTACAAVGVCGRHDACMIVARNAGPVHEDPDVTPPPWALDCLAVLKALDI